MEEARLLEEARLAEARKEEIARLEVEVRFLEEARLWIEARLEEEARLLEQARVLEEEASRLKEEAQRIESERVLIDPQSEEDDVLLEQARLMEEEACRLREEVRLMEESRLKEEEARNLRKSRYEEDVRRLEEETQFLERVRVLDDVLTLENARLLEEPIASPVNGDEPKEKEEETEVKETFQQVKLRFEKLSSLAPGDLKQKEHRSRTQYKKKKDMVSDDNTMERPSHQESTDTKPDEDQEETEIEEVLFEQEQQELMELDILEPEKAESKTRLATDRVMKLEEKKLEDRDSALEQSCGEDDEELKKSVKTKLKEVRRNIVNERTQASPIPWQTTMYFTRYTESSRGDHLQSGPRQNFHFEFKMPEDGDLGIFLHDLELPEEEGSKGIFVKGFVPGSSGWRDSRLFTNDQLVSINGISLAGM